MQIKIGRQYINKTWRFLVPCLKAYGVVFLSRFNPLFKLAAAIHDTYLDESEISNGRNLYILIDKKYKPREYEKFMEYIKYQDYYINDYCPDSEIINSRKTTVILRIPELFENAYDKFLQGKYSEMYTEEELNILYGRILDSKNPSKEQLAKRLDYEILSKTGTSSFNNFVKVANDEFNTKLDYSHFYNSEWELPLKKEEEIFNYTNKKGVFFNEKLDKKWQ